MEISKRKEKILDNNFQGITKRGDKWRINIGVNGKMYYLGTAKSIEEAIETRDHALSLIENNTFEEWYHNTHDIFDREESGEYLSFTDAAIKIGIDKTNLQNYIRKLGLKPIRHKKDAYLSLVDIERIISKIKDKEDNKAKKRTNKNSLIKIKNPDGRRARCGKDITGMQINFLKAIEPTGKKERHYKAEGFSYVWIWECVCGKRFEMSLAKIKSLRKQSCGCKEFDTRREAIKENAKKAGLYKGTMVSLLRTKKIRPNNNTGITGVSFQKSTGKYVAYICVSKKRYNLGTYDNIEDAKKARLKAEKKYFEPIIKEYESKQ